MVLFLLVSVYHSCSFMLFGCRVFLYFISFFCDAFKATRILRLRPKATTLLFYPNDAGSFMIGGVDGTIRRKARFDKPKVRLVCIDGVSACETTTTY